MKDRQVSQMHVLPTYSYQARFPETRKQALHRFKRQAQIVAQISARPV